MKCCTSKFGQPCACKRHAAKSLPDGSIGAGDWYFRQSTPEDNPKQIIPCATCSKRKVNLYGDPPLCWECYHRERVIVT